ncbi:winged helix-turn-helix domain-containing protein [Halosimplex pelagicum]|uniref:winged helix-turn-helix domain-containing protein n=1 Tax=Halosimplex pelagicum TaxID=869886 RepID=UPI001C54D8B7|nr:winged helix-turn-helix domain-containing protein [Halosimplex pelagicum]
MALDKDDLNETDREILDVLHEGRATPLYVAERVDITRPYASDKLKRLLEHGVVERLASGLYELADDPREDGTDDTAEEGDRRADVDTRDLVDDWLWEHHGMGVDDLDEMQADLDDCRERLAAQDGADPERLAEARDALARGLERLPDDAPGRTPLADAQAILDEVVDDGE